MDDLLSVVTDEPPAITESDDATVTQTGDDVTVQVGKTEPSAFVYSEASHDENLLDYIDEHTLSTLAGQILEDVKADKESRADWQHWVAQSLKIFGIAQTEKDKTTLSQVVHPLLAEAVVQTQARMLAEILPPQGPVKCIQLGEKTPEKQDQAERVEGFLNYHLTERDEGYFDDTDQMFLYLAKDGSVFRKVYFDPMEGMIVSRMVKGEDLIVPYTASLLRTATRYTHQFPLTPHQMQRYIDSDFYADVGLSPPEPRADDDSEAKSATDLADNRQDSKGQNDGQHQMYEHYCFWEFEELVYPDGEPELNPLTQQPPETRTMTVPYTITVEEESQKIVAVYLGWKFGDPLKKRQDRFIHHKYLPGFGFYGMGLTHLIGHLASSATGIVRAYLDAAIRANFPGGYKSKDIGIPGGETVIEPGEWKDADCSAQELKDGFFPLPYKEPSDGLFRILEFILGAGQRMASTVDAMVGDANNNGPVGTTVALIEQGSKILSGVHKRVHASMRRELRLIGDTQYQHGEDIEHWNYEGGSGQVMREDFDDRIDIAPVSDPNLFSVTQKTAIAQAMLELQKQYPHLFDEFDAVEYMVKAINGPAYILKDPKDIPRCDPVTEGARLIAHKQVKAFQDQDHAAHKVVHSAQIAMAQQMLPPDQAQIVVAGLLEHNAQHDAFSYQAAVQADSPVPLPPLDFDDDTGIPAEAEIPISQVEAQVVTQMQQQMMAQQQAEAMAQQQAAEGEQQAKAQQDEALKRQDAEKEQADKVAQREHEVRLAKLKGKPGEGGAEGSSEGPDPRDEMMLQAIQHLGANQQQMMQQMQMVVQEMAQAFGNAVGQTQAKPDAFDVERDEKGAIKRVIPVHKKKKQLNQ